MIEFFDGGFFVGRNPQDGSHSDGAGRVGLVASFKAVWDDQEEGNAATLIHCKQNKNHSPLTVVQPLRWTSDSKKIQSLKKYAAVLLCPGLQSGSTQRLAFHQCVGDLSRAGIALQVMISEAHDMKETLAALSTPLKAPVMFRFWKGGGYSHLADIMAAARLHKKIFFDVSHLVSNGQVAWLCSQIGADRLFLASHSPLVITDSVVGSIATCPHLKAADKKIILSGYALRKSLKIEVPKKMEAAFNGKLPPEWNELCNAPKFDTHWHSDGWDLLEPRKGLKEAILYLDRFHYRGVGISSITALNYDVIDGNKRLFDALEMDERFFAHVVVDPLRPDESFRLLETYHTHPRFLGLKTIQDYYGLGLDDARYSDFLAWAGKHRCPVMAHIPGMAAAAQAHPQTKFIAAHTTWDRLPRLTLGKDLVPSNIYFDIATSHALAQATQMKRLILHLGAERFLFSVDGPLMNPAWTLGKLVDAALSDDVLQKILFHNAANLFDAWQSHVS
jgi:predicted TIM-barrel fold metal-dependent hydrolase